MSESSGESLACLCRRSSSGMSSNSNSKITDGRLRKQAERLNFVAPATYAFGQLGCGRLGRGVGGLGDGSEGVGVAAVAGVGAGDYPQLRQPATAHASSVRGIASNMQHAILIP